MDATFEQYKVKSKQVSKLNKLDKIIQTVKYTIITTNKNNRPFPTYIIDNSLNDHIKRINKTVFSNFSEKFLLFTYIPHQGHIEQLKYWINENLPEWCTFRKLLKESLNTRAREIITERIL